MKNKKLVWGLVIFAIVSVLFYLGFKYICFECIKLDALKPENIKAWISQFGPFAFVVYVLLYMVNTVVVFPPIAVMSLSAGILFGPLWGTVAIMTGAFLGTTSTFFISRKLGSGFAQKFIKGDKAESFQKKLSDNGFVVILPMRLIGLPPWEILNYIAGLSKISYKDYILATMIGIAPASFAQAFLTDRLSDFNWKDPTLYIAIGVFVLFITVLPKLINKKAPVADTEGENHAS